jgi:hypothetical protein
LIPYDCLVVGDRMPMKMPGDIDIPPALLSLMAIVFVSKMARNEFRSWIKLMGDWAK